MCELQGKTPEVSSLGRKGTETLLAVGNQQEQGQAISTWHLQNAEASSC